MNLQALRIFKERSQCKEDIAVFKEYLENLFPHINANTVGVYWDDFVDIVKEMVQIFLKLGFNNINDYYNVKIKNAKVAEESFKEIVGELYSVATEYVRVYENTKRYCSLCKREVYYLPLPEEYKRLQQKYNFPSFRAETLNEEEYVCPICGSLDRDRLMVSYLELSGVLDKPEVRALQIAPSRAIEEYLLINYPNLRYSSGDLYMEGVSFQMDIQDMHMIADNSYDIWICSHVLEHIPDDRKALKELSRILKKSGIGLLLVPLDLDQQDTDEELGCSEEENWRRFGQGDHVRKYAKHDFLKRVTGAGFTVECLGRDFFGEKLFRDNGLTSTATLYVLKKRNDR